MTKFIFINWRTKDVVMTTSRPKETEPPVLKSSPLYMPQGKKAKTLIDAGYTCIGFINGYNVGSLNILT